MTVAICQRHQVPRHPRQRRRLLALLLLAPLALAAAPADAQSLDALFADGKAAYLEGRYDDAVRTWERLRDAGVQDADVEYDLGLAHIRAGNHGAAALAFERALRLRDDHEAREALAVTRTRLAERRAAREGEASLGTESSFADALVAPFSEPTLAWALLGLELLLLVSLVLLVRLPRLRAALVISTVLVSLLFVAAGVGLLVKRGVFRDGRLAIVLTEELTLREGPDERTAARGSAHEGERVMVLEEEDEFVLLRVRDRRGWATRASVGLVD